MPIRRELIDELLKEAEDRQDILGEDGLLKELSKALIERSLEAELETHLGYAKHERTGTSSVNSRNGHSHKTLKGDLGEICNIAKKWTMPIRDWKPALNRFAIEFAGRFPH